MSALFGTKAANAIPASALNVQTAVQGLPVPLLWGRTKIAGNLIAYTDFKAVQQGSSGGKGGLVGSSSGKGSAGGYYYSAAIAIALCEGPITSVDSVWNDKTQQTLASLNLTAFTGTYVQTAWGYTTSLHPTQALNYRGLAYVAAGPLALGSSPVLPNLSFEVTGALSFAVAGLPDADPSAVISDVLTNPYYGIGLGTSRVGDLSVYTAYCRATGMLVSPSVADLTTGQDFIKALLEATNTGAVWSQGQLRLVPYGDQALVSGTIVPVTEPHTIPVPLVPAGQVAGPPTIVLSYPGVFVADGGVVNAQSGAVFTKVGGAPGTGQYQSPTPGTYIFAVADEQTPIAVTFSYTEPASYTPPVAPYYAFGDDDYVMGGSSGSSQPVTISRSAPQDQKNSVIVNYLDRANSYNLTPTPAAKDDAAIQAFGLRQDSIHDYHFFCYPQAALQSAALLLGRQQVRNTYSFTVGQRYVMLDPMDLVSLTDTTAGLVNQWVRITEIQENDDLTLTISAEDYLSGSAAAPLYGHEPNTGYTPNYQQDPGYINTPVIFEPPSTLTGGTNELWVAVSGGSTVWGGCDVYVSYDGSTYASVDGAHQIGPARTGFLTAALPIGAAMDTVNTLAVDISAAPGAQLTSGTLADATSLSTLCYVDGELIAYQTATLTALGHYALAGLVRGAYGTPIAAHIQGSQFARLDGQIIKIPFNKALIGGGIFLKFVSFNIWGQGNQTLAEVTPIEYTFGGGQPPGVIIGITATLAQSGLATTLIASWTADALSISYQAQISSDAGVTWTTVYDGGLTNIRVDGLKASALVLRIRGVTSTGIVGIWASVNVLSPTLTSANSGYNAYVSYKDLIPNIVDNVLGNDVELDLNDLASFVALVKANNNTTTATTTANSAAAAVLQQTAGQVPSITVALALQTSGITAQVSALNTSLLNVAAQDAANAALFTSQVNNLTAQFTNSASLSSGISVVQAGINTASALQRDDIIVGSNLNADAGELLAFQTAVQTGNAVTIQAQALSAATAGIVTQAVANTTAISAQALQQTALAAAFQTTVASITTTASVQATSISALSSQTTALYASVGSNSGAISALQGVTASQGSTLASLQTTVNANFSSNSASIVSLQTSTASQAGTLAALQATVTSNYNNDSSSISSLQTTTASQGSTLAILQTTVNSNYSSNAASIASLSSTNTSQDNSLAALQSTVSANYSSNSASISNLQATNASQDSTIAALQNTVNTNYNNNYSSIVSLQGTVSSQGSTLATIQTTVTSNYNSTTANISSNTSSINTLSNQYGSLSTQINAVSAQSAAGTANGQIQFQAQSAPSGVSALFSLVLSAQGYASATGGFSIALIGGQVNTIFQSSTFQIQNGANKTVPFAIDGNGVVSLQGVTRVASTIVSQTFVGGNPALLIDFVNGALSIYDAS